MHAHGGHGALETLLQWPLEDLRVAILAQGQGEGAAILALLSAHGQLIERVQYSALLLFNEVALTSLRCGLLALEHLVATLHLAKTGLQTLFKSFQLVNNVLIARVQQVLFGWWRRQVV